DAVDAFVPAPYASPRSPVVPTRRSSDPDTTAPSVPAGLLGTAASISQINLSWSASTDPDNTASQINYDVYRNGTKIGTSHAGVTNFSDTGLAANTTYSYAIDAFDPAGNTSARSAVVSVA